MSVRVQRYENLIKEWASLVSFRIRHFYNFENRIERVLFRFGRQSSALFFRVAM